MRKFLTILTATLALNFVAVLAGLVYLTQSGRLDRQKVQAIKDILFAEPATGPSTQPAATSSTQGAAPLDALLTRHSNLPVSDQVEVVRRSFDAQMSLLERRQRELNDLQRQVEMARHQLVKDRAALEESRKALQSRVDEAAKLANDKGFQDSLERYQSLPPKQVKMVFLGLDDATVIRYLQAMDARQAGKIMKEFKEPEEMERLKRLMERMRQSQLASGDK